MNNVIVYTEQVSNRLRYIVMHLFHTILGFDVQIVTTEKELENTNAILINYSKKAIDGTFKITPFGLLWEENIKPQQVECTMWKDMPIFFQTRGDIPFDILSASFFLITRYEEYLPTKLDRHGRFSHENSIAYKNGFLQRPLVDLWAIQLLQILDDEHPVGRSFQVIPTIDVDNFYKYRRRGICVTLALLLRDLFKGDLHELNKRWNVVFHRLRDPYFNFDSINALHERYAIHPRYFFHVGGMGRWDMHTLFPMGSIHYRRKIKELAMHYHVGVHPSYNATNDCARIRKEKRRLEHLVGKKIKRSRFHFLRMTLPYSYRMLIEVGIKSDYSMLYSDAIGFRASTSIPFHFYDLEKNEVCDLYVQPVALMDATLLRLRAEGAEDLLNQVLMMLKDVRKVQGRFITLYHNQHLTYEHVSQWNKDFYKSLLRAATEIK